MSFKRISALLLALYFVLAMMPATVKADDSGVPINSLTFPDGRFRSYILSQDYGADSILTPEEAASIIILDVSDQGISDLTGIEYFTSLQSLLCSDNWLTWLNVTKNTQLLDLICDNNQLTRLNVSQNTKLQNLWCQENQLTSLDLSQNTDLDDLRCSDNQLTALDVSQNTALTILYCSSNQLSSLDLSKNIALEELVCSYNPLTTLDVSQNTALTDLHCSGAELTSLDVSNNPVLTELWCQENQLTGLDVSHNPALTGLWCSDNQLADLDVSKNTSLTILNCYGNRLTSLNVSDNPALEELYCYTNQLPSLDVRQCPAMRILSCSNNQMAGLDVSQNTALEQLSIGSNQLTDLDVSKNPALINLYCDYNQLSSLDISSNTALRLLYCVGNQLTGLDVSQNAALTRLYCAGNQLSTLDVSTCAALMTLDCSQNQLTALDVSKNAELSALYCSNNQLTSLDVTCNPSLSNLYCKNNSYHIQLDGNSQFDLTTLPGGFDVTKASDWAGGTLSGSILTAQEQTITYTYQMGENWSETFTLTWEHVSEFTRVAGDDRFQTAFKVANELKAALGVEKFDTIILASGSNFADALSGSYLAAVKSAPILLTASSGAKHTYINQNTVDYVKANLAQGGTVYILGGTAAVPQSVDEMLAGYNVVRLAGRHRYDTNLKILQEAGVPEDSELLVCTGSSFADSLSASATGLPIFLVNGNGNTLYNDQIDFLLGLDDCKFTVIGGESAISYWLGNTFQNVGPVKRLAGANRFETSVLVAEKYFPETQRVVLAYSQNFPDGLCGGSLAYALGAPLVLTMEGRESWAMDYVQRAGIYQAWVLGGDKLIPDASVCKILAMD